MRVTLGVLVLLSALAVWRAYEAGWANGWAKAQAEVDTQNSLPARLVPEPVKKTKPFAGERITTGNQNIGVGPLLAGEGITTGNQNIGVGTLPLMIRTLRVCELPSDALMGDVAAVYDGADAEDCHRGGGKEIVLCLYGWTCREDRRNKDCSDKGWVAMAEWSVTLPADKATITKDSPDTVR